MSWPAEDRADAVSETSDVTASLSLELWLNSLHNSKNFNQSRPSVRALGPSKRAQQTSVSYLSWFETAQSLIEAMVPNLAYAKQVLLDHLFRSVCMGRLGCE